ncbi:alpha/beta hydrolase [Chitinophaga ginsengisegetis]|uniref:alpha/beta hydrolase n=1 Tax=Chitinophaga ginsengisegetis TaxID=393003 RepID=UPI000DB9513A|nr:alpha/beta hydrolase-fold protein [Chitinophaga ginsengisegetis]MDR6568270.1 S-formylglutathione hydrolase FrmB [Chitinophaga ginsengisegetis]MDR6648499.1 S-formylglutathione hydrolase FrmB [Chitinophaga ginsengisegetis]MDR6654351.1 S-formylglutathione hydrolase FrmB [Chitinophaga ginsengisegetis]
MIKYLASLTIAFVFILLSCSVQSLAQQPGIAKGTVQRIKVHSKLLEGNLSGDSADRYVSVYLPAGYSSGTKKRYPVVYFLHGYTDNDAKFYGFQKHWMTLPPILDTAFSQSPGHEMIVVTPDAYTLFQGSMYSNSVTTGNWEDFVASELVGYIDSHYRTLAQKESRGLCGHSMGGYGALRIGEKNPGVFSTVYLLSPCCLNSPAMSSETLLPQLLRADSIKTIEEFQKSDFFTKALFASAAAWSPNPGNPPFYLDLPVKNGNLQPQILQKWDANRPINNLDQYIYNIRKLKSIGFDAGDKDRAIAESIKTLDEELSKYRIEHFFEIYEGDHINRIANRIEENMLQFFSKHLSFKQNTK